MVEVTSNPKLPSRINKTDSPGGSCSCQGHGAMDSEARGDAGFSLIVLFDITATSLPLVY